VVHISFFFFSSRRRHTRFSRDWSSDVCSSDLDLGDRQLTLTAFPIAHTSTDITVFDSKTQTLWTGDLLFVERTPSIDGDIKGWRSEERRVGKECRSRGSQYH